MTAKAAQKLQEKRVNHAEGAKGSKDKGDYGQPNAQKKKKGSGSAKTKKKEAKVIHPGKLQNRKSRIKIKGPTNGSGVLGKPAEQRRKEIIGARSAKGILFRGGSPTVQIRTDIRPAGQGGGGRGAEKSVQKRSRSRSERGKSRRWDAGATGKTGKQARQMEGGSL